ncbi:hypothetical protein IX51_01815 [uncultured archaeon]|nr:hypothetical protein IX51_01815 [uncultured archaeon]
MVTKRKVGQRGLPNETRGYIINALATGYKSLKEITTILSKEIGISQQRTIRNHLSVLISQGIVHSDGNQKDEYNRTRSQSKKKIHYSLSFKGSVRVPLTFQYMCALGNDILHDFMVSPWFRQFAVLYSLRFADAAKYIMSEELIPDVDIHRVLTEDMNSNTPYEDTLIFPDLVVNHLEDLIKRSSNLNEANFFREKMPKFRGSVKNLEKSTEERKRRALELKESWKLSSDQALGTALLLGFEKYPPEDVIASIIRLINEDQRGSVISRAILTFPDSTKAFFDWITIERPDEREINGEFDPILCHFVKILRTKKERIHLEGINEFAKGSKTKSTEFKIVGSSILAISDILDSILRAIDFTNSIFQLGMLENYLTHGTDDRLLKRKFFELHHAETK